MASVAQLDKHLTTDQENRGLIPAGLGNIISWRFSMIIFSFQLIQEGQLSVSGKRMSTSTG